VDVAWTDERTGRIRFENADPESLTEIPNWQYARFEEYLERGDAYLAISSNDPDLLEGIDPDLIARNRKARAERFDPLRKYDNTYNWCVVSTATPAWAKKVFPGLPPQESQAKLWDAIFKSSRIDTADPVKAWESHITRLLKYKDYLTSKHYTALHYTGPETDLTVGLPEKHLWMSAQMSTKNGITFTPNLPTEEVFTTPHKDKAHGIVKASRPLNLSGTLIEDFSVVFENGRVVKVHAQKGEEVLRKLLETDATAGQLGEVALVPNSSPISQRNHLFYNTLFDENAACHIALGNAYRDAMAGGIEMTEEEFQANGGNKSVIHTDFMIGSDTLNIDGIQADGAPEPIMRAGEWAFEV
jgi:aminopeptidase